MNIWNALTDSMYNFYCYFDKYRGQCKGSGPVDVSCATLDWNADCKSMIGKIGAIIAAQCAECSGNGVCAQWYGFLSQLEGLAGEGISYGGGNKPIPYCDEKQCSTGTHECDAYATCTEECKDYTCTCNEGYEGNGKKCSLICDADECAAGYTNPCGAFSVCTNECTGYSCACMDGYAMDNGACMKVCDDGYENINNECIIICADGWIVTKDNTCYKVCDDGYENINNKCVIICDDGYVVSATNTCYKVCVHPYVNQNNVCILTCEAGWHVENDKCIKDCDEDQCANALSCPQYSTCSNDCYGYTCTCIAGYHKDGDKCVLTCDNDPCANGGTTACGAYSTCTNKCKGYTCGCIAGYSMVKGVCTKDCDADPCAGNTCGAYSNCVRECFGYNCVCDKDYIPIDGTNDCKHKDPCNGVKCVAYSKCDGGKCKCLDGYAWKDGKCKEKVNECITGSHNCHKYATCTDTLWGFTCKCNDGYKVLFFSQVNEINQSFYRIHRMVTGMNVLIRTTPKLASVISPSTRRLQIKNLRRCLLPLLMIIKAQSTTGK